jgi:hypothetical protein
MVATVRNRRGGIGSVRPFDGPEGRLHLVDIEYNDGESPFTESLLWERETFARLLPPSAPPDPAADDPMSNEDLNALVRACRWSARTPFVGWMLPETPRLADYGLGHDDRAKEHQPVASRLGPRFYDWLLGEDGYALPPAQSSNRDIRPLKPGAGCRTELECPTIDAGPTVAARTQFSTSTGRD